jgi:glycosyltransferase involved in cell wall biosynthesis
MSSLVKRGDEVDFLCLRLKKQSTFEMKNGIGIYRIQKREYKISSVIQYINDFLRFFFISTWMCTRLHLQKKYDIIHFHNIPDFGVFCAFIPKLTGSKIILDIHDLVPEFYQRKFSVSDTHPIIRLLKWIEKLSAQFANHVLTATDIWYDKLISRSVSPACCTVILNAPMTQLFHSPDKVIRKRKEHVVLSYHGNLIESTGVDLLIRSMVLVLKKVPNARLQIIGKGSEESYLKSLSIELALSDYIDFKGSVPNEEISTELAGVDIGIDPKRGGIYAGETLSVKALEYLAMGIPLIVSRTKAARMYFNSTFVQFFEPDNHIDLAWSIINIIHLKKCRKQMIEKGIQFIQTHKWSIYEKKYFKVIYSLCNTV